MNLKFTSCDDRGAALVVALLSMGLMTALGLALVLTTSTELGIAANYRDADETLYAAEAGLERAIADLRTLPDLSPVLRGEVLSGFRDGLAAGATRVLADGHRFDLTTMANLNRCGRTTGCSDAEMNTSTDERPWGPNNPRWQPYAYGPLSALIASGTIASQHYVVVWAGDDPSENDTDPTTDGADISNPGSGIAVLRAEAFGPGGSHRTIEATVARSDEGPSLFRVLAWRVLR
jgi:hypothetical protein